VTPLPTESRDDRAGPAAPGSRDDRDGGAERLAEVVPLRGTRELDGLALLLRAPEGAVGFELPDPTPIDHRGVRPALLADVLDDALDHLAIRWE
jgi:hypothetical protein